MANLLTVKVGHILVTCCVCAYSHIREKGELYCPGPWVLEDIIAEWDYERGDFMKQFSVSMRPSALREMGQFMLGRINRLEMMDEPEFKVLVLVPDDLKEGVRGYFARMKMFHPE